MSRTARFILRCRGAFGPDDDLSGHRGVRGYGLPWGAMMAAWLCCAAAWADSGGTPLTQSSSSRSPAHRTSTSLKTDLMQAARSGDTALVAGLLKRGAPVNARNGNGGTALMYAAVGGHLDAVDLLIRRGADVNAQSANGWGALMIACAKGYRPIIERLLAAGAAANQSDVYGWTPLMRAVYEQRQTALEVLFFRPDLELDAVNEHGSSALHLAAVVGDQRSAQALLERGADVTIRDAEGRTAADIAAARGDSRLARLLGAGSPRSRTPPWAKSSS